MKLNIIDLFAGCGGLTDGFLRTNKFNSLVAVDWELPTVQTLRERMRSKYFVSDVTEKVLHFDIQRTEELIFGYNDPIYGESKGFDEIVNGRNVDVIIGGPPCQAYSIAGRVRDSNGMKDDYRNYLFESYVRVVDHYKPKAFVFENVEGILSAEPGGIKITERIKEAFNNIGYEISDNLREQALFDTSYYNVPQKRKRVIIYGVLKNKDSLKKINKFYNLMKSKATDLPMPAKSAFNGLPKYIPLEKVKTNGIKKSHFSFEEDAGVYNHEPRFHSERDIEIFKTLTKDIATGTFKFTSTEALIELYELNTGKKSKFHKYHVIRVDKPSNTIPAHLYKDGLRHIHPDPLQARSITVREAARLQAFDDDFIFFGSKGDQFKMIGNAVPPSFAEHIANAVYELNTVEIKSHYQL